MEDLRKSSIDARRISDMKRLSKDTITGLQKTYVQTEFKNKTYHKRGGKPSNARLETTYNLEMSVN